MHPSGYSTLKECNECSVGDSDHAWERPSTGTYITHHVTKNMIHVHFGYAVREADVIHTEAYWIYSIFMNHIYTPEQNHNAIVLTDLSRVDEQLYPRYESLQLYSDIMKHPSTGLLICYGVNTTLKFILQILTRMSGSKKRTVVVHSKMDADVLAEQWFNSFC